MHSASTVLEQTEREMCDLTARPVAFDDWKATIKALPRGWKASLVDEAFEIFHECSQPGWDGYDAVELSEEAVVNAKNFINLLPDGVSQPDLVPSPDGWLSFEWRSPEDRILSVTIENGVLIYAASVGQDDVHYGRVPLEEYREKFPPCIENILSEYF